MKDFEKAITAQMKQLVILISRLESESTKLRSDLDDHLLEHMIEDRNKEFDLRYPIEDD